jgi:hypothetical protein
MENVLIIFSPDFITKIHSRFNCLHITIIETLRHFLGVAMKFLLSLQSLPLRMALPVPKIKKIVLVQVIRSKFFSNFS